MSREKIVLEAEQFAVAEESEVSEETKEKSKTEDGIYVKGMALPFGKVSRNGVQYEQESVKAAAGDLEGRPMLFNHKMDWVTGHILNTEVTEDGMYFEGDLNPNAEMPNGVTVAEAVERGDIASVSIQAFAEEIGEADEDALFEDETAVKVKVRDFLEISAVSIPGFPSTSAMPEHLKNQGVHAVTELVEKHEENKEKEEKEGDRDQSAKEQKESELKEAFEFSPVPTHVLYEDSEDAMQRARNLGLEDTHEYELSGQIYYMAGDNHDEWLQAIERENSREQNDSSEDNTMGDQQEEQEQDTNSENQVEELSQNEVEGIMGMVESELNETRNRIESELENMMDGESEGEDEYDDKDEDDPEEEQSEEETEQESNKDREELKDKIDSLEEKNEELEERLETILDNDEGQSKQETPDQESSNIEKRPSFKDVV